MQRQLEELKQYDPEQLQDYLNLVKNSVDNKTYFKDAVNWYLFRYVSPVCDRSLLIFSTIIASISLFFLLELFDSSFPLVRPFPIVIGAKDQTSTYPSLLKIKPKANDTFSNKLTYDPNILTVDEAFCRYLLINYVNERESYNYSKAKIEDIIKKMTHIRNTSSSDEYAQFQVIMDKKNQNSPVKYFGRDVFRTVNVQSIKFIRQEPKDFSEKAMTFLSIKMPTQAEIRFIATTTNNENELSKEIKEKYLAKINFFFSGTSKNGKTLNLTVNSYKLYKIK
jgi:type IV secretory pathway component VirB8